MSNFSVKLESDRPWRYVFNANLLENRKGRFGLPVKVLVDTGSFNTIIHERLVAKYGVMTNHSMMTAVGGFRGEARICILNKIKIGNTEIEKVAALAVPFEGELKDHILLGANVTNNWEFTLSRKKNSMVAVEDFSDNAPSREHPYRYYFNNKGKIIALQEMDASFDN